MLGCGSRPGTEEDSRPSLRIETSITDQPSNRPTYTSPSINDKLSFSPSNAPAKKKKKKIFFLPLISPSRRFRKKTRSFRSDYSHVMRTQQRIDIFQPIELDRGRGSTAKLDRPCHFLWLSLSSSPFFFSPPIAPDISGHVREKGSFPNSRNGDSAVTKTRDG